MGITRQLVVCIWPPGNRTNYSYKSNTTKNDTEAQEQEDTDDVEAYGDVYPRNGTELAAMFLGVCRRLHLAGWLTRLERRV